LHRVEPVQLSGHFACGLILRREGFGPGGFTFCGSYTARGNDRLPGRQPLGCALIDCAVRARNFSNLTFFAASAALLRSSKLTFLKRVIPSGPR
jgi:hypothetical protein